MRSARGPCSASSMPRAAGRQQPPPVLVAGIATLTALVQEVPEPIERLVAEFWPGGLTIVLPSQPSLAWDLGETRGTVARADARAPHRARTARGDRSPGRLQRQPHRAARRPWRWIPRSSMLGDSVSVYLNGGPSATGVASTIIDATSLVGPPRTTREPRVRVLRDGAVSREQLREVLADLLEEDPATSEAGRRRVKQYVFTILFTAAMTLSLAWAVWQLSLRYKLYPGIRERDVHKNPTPRLGGVAIYLAIVAAIAVSAANPFFEIFWVNPRPVVAILIASTIIVLVGVADDLWDLDWMIKLGAQFLAAGVIAWFGELQIYSLPIGGLAVGSSVVSVTLTVFAIVIVMNAVNFIDGLDGLVAGVCLISNAHLLRVLLHARPRHRLEHLLQPRLLPRRRAGRRVRRLPAAELEPREALHGRLRARSSSAC